MPPDKKRKLVAEEIFKFEPEEKQKRLQDQGQKPCISPCGFKALAAATSK